MKLFEPLTIRNMTLKNRIVMAPMVLNLGLRNRRVQAYYMERARGGVGTIIMHATAPDLFIDDEAWGAIGGVSSFRESMRSFTAEVRKTGAHVGIQLWHGNQIPAIVGKTNGVGADNIAPSAWGGMREMAGEEIESLVDKYGKAGAAAKAMGFDFVELHGAHGYLLNQFFSGRSNWRTDEYGGNVHKRMTVGLEAVRRIRDAVGDSFPVFFRLGAHEEHPDGITLDESRLYAAQLERVGVDVIDVSVGNNDDRRSSPQDKMDMGTFVYLAEGIKSEVEVPVVAVGRINTPEIAESILADGRADLVAIGRQLIADPNWAMKALEGRGDEVIACESCNTCFRPLLSRKWKPGDPICKVNPWAGREIDQ